MPRRLENILKRLSKLAMAGLVAFSLTAKVRAEEVPQQIIHIQKIEQAPKIDGVLDDSCWESLETLTGFYTTQHKKFADKSEQTEVKTCYDNNNIYFYFYNHSPDTITAEQVKRGAFLSKDDYIEVSLDTAHKHQWGGSFNFSVNPIGTQNETIPGGSALITEWRGDWKAAAKIIEDGWTAEMAIPLKMLRYPTGQKSFGLAFSRNIARTLQYFSWPYTGEVSDTEKEADLVDLELPPVKRPVLLMPYNVTDFREGALTSSFGLDVKTTFEGGLTGLLAYNPDFKSIEGAVLNLDPSYTERMVPETRPFFIEGSSGFFPSTTIFYTQRIGEIDAGLKIFGEVKDFSLGFMGTSAFGERTDLAGALKYKVNENINVSAAHVKRSEDALKSTAQDFGASYGRDFPAGYFLAGVNYVTSDNRESTLEGSKSPKGTYKAYSVSLWPENKKIGGFLSYSDISKDFDPRDGLVYEVDKKGYYASLFYDSSEEKGRVEKWSLNLGYGASERQDGSFFHDDFGAFFDLHIRDSLSLNLGYTATDRFDFGSLFQDEVVSISTGWNRQSQSKRGSIGYNFGKMFGKDYYRISLSQGFKPADNLTFNVSLEQRDLGGEIARQYIITGIHDLSVDKSISGRWLYRNGQSNVYFAYKDSQRDGRDLYILLGNPNTEKTEKELIVKVMKVIPFGY